MLNIEKISDVPYDSAIYTPKDFELMASAKEYMVRVECECKEKLSKCASEVEKIKQEAYAEGLAKACAENKILLDESLNKITSYLASLNQNISTIIQTVLYTMGYESISSEQINQLISREINKLNTNPNLIQVKSNKLTQDKIKHLFNDKVEYSFDETLHDDVCVYKTELFSLQLDINDYIKTISSVLESSLQEQV